MKRKDIAALLRRAAAAIETPADLTQQERDDAATDCVDAARQFDLADTKGTPPMFKLTLETNNDAFTEYPMEEVARILRAVATKLENGIRGDTCRDINGNPIGEYNLTGH